MNTNQEAITEKREHPSYVITLVHGTWADTRGWVAPGSVLRRELDARLGSVVFREFPWSSAHTHAARTEAGVRLARFVRGGHTQYPEARHFIIGHSHGGVVALYAMRDAAANQVVSGIITLATPFVSTRRRRFRPYVRAITFLLIAAPVVAGALLLAAMWPRQPVLLTWVLGGAFLTVRADRPMSKWLIGVVRRWQSEIIAPLEPPPIGPSRLLILCSRGDEAYGWLRAWDLVSHAPFVVAGVLLSTLGIVARVLLQSRIEIALPIVLVAVEVMAAIVVVSGLVRWPGYGREWVLPHLLVDIRAASTPDELGASSHAAHLFDVPRPSARTERWRRRLRHKAICQTAAVAGAIADWIGFGVAIRSAPTLPVNVNSLVSSAHPDHAL
jgi:hypothetical protein